MNEVRHGSWSSEHERASTTDVLLLRHGETILTPQRRFSGTGGGDLPLSPVGREQAQQAGQSPALRSAAISAVLCSPLRRCVETAEIVATQLNLPVRVDEDLREMDFGAWEGLTFAEAEQRHPVDLAAWKRSADVPPTGSTDTFGDVLLRAAGLVGRLCSFHPDSTVLLVSHVTPIKAFVAHALQTSPMAFFSMELSSAALTRITYTGSDRLLRFFNDTAHLRSNLRDDPTTSPPPTPG